MKKELKYTLELESIEKYREDFLKNKGFKVATNAVTRNNLKDIAINREIFNNDNWTFSHEIKEKADITNQKKSGTCWLFAELNWLRTFTMRKFNIEKLEFSENFLMFYDKLEKSNYYLEELIKRLDCDIDDRYIRFLLDRPARDGGEWHMIANLIDKYGLIPKEIMPDTYNRENSALLNEMISYKIREAYLNMRKMARSDKQNNEIRNYKENIMKDIFNILAVCMGIPPKKFNWSYRDKDKKYHKEVNIKPKDFYNKYIGLDFNKCYTLVNCPTDETPYDNTYCIDLFTNMGDRPLWKWLNTPISEIKKIAVKMLKDGEAVLFGCDVLQQSHSKEGFLSTKLYDFDLLFQTSFNMNKQERLESGQSRLTHSMVLTGVELEEDNPVRWKVENSWGKDVGQNGFFVMTDKWFDEHVLDLIVTDKYMPEDLKKTYEKEPELLPPWHVMA